MIELSPTAALVLIDLQRAIDDPFWSREGARNNPGAEANVERLLARWRARYRPIFHIRHDSMDPNSTFRPGGSGHPFKPQAQPLASEIVLGKRTANAFLSTDLEARLHASNVKTLVVAGVITNNSVESTVRMAGEIGFSVLLVEDACFTFGKRDWRGQFWTAQDVHALSLANLDGEYCRIVRTDDVLK